MSKYIQAKFKECADFVIFLTDFQAITSAKDQLKRATKFVIK